MSKAKFQIGEVVKVKNTGELHKVALIGDLPRHKLYELDNHKCYYSYGLETVHDKQEDNIKASRNIILTLEKAKEWYKKGGELKEVALQAFEEEELSDDKPRSWEEYCELMKINKRLGYDILNDGSIDTVRWTLMNTPEQWRTTLPSKELAEASIAMMQLISLRQAWIGDWKPDVEANMYGIVHAEEGIRRQCIGVYTPLSFPTKEMTEYFMNCFKDLLEKAKGLY